MATREHQLLLRLVDIPGDRGILLEFLNPRRSGEGAIVYSNMIAHGQSLALAAKLFHGTPIMPLINILRLSEDDATRWFRLDEDDELVIFIIVRLTSTTSEHSLFCTLNFRVSDKSL